MEPRPLRHAYLIMTHGSFPILEKQLRFLDSDNADFYVHVDAKAGEIDTDRFCSLPRRSRVTFIDRIDVRWGDFSQVEGELALLKASAAAGYDYYHLLSGVDVPIKSRAYIEQYFAERAGTNFLKFQASEISEHDLARVKYYHPFQHMNIRSRALRKLLREASRLPQRLVGTDRTRSYPGVVFQKGTNWFSLTDEAVHLVLSQEALIRRFCRSSCCADEIFVQTVIFGSPLRHTLADHAFENDFRSCCRYVDWSRGDPYTFTDGDLDELVFAGADYLFARKFDYAAHPGVVDRLFEIFGEDQGGT